VSSSAYDEGTTNKYFADEAKHFIDKIRKERTVIYQTESTESTPVSLALVGRMVPSQEWDFQ
jgi:hypothetical protein